MFSVLWRTIKNRKTSLLAYSLGAAGFMEMYIAMFPFFADKQEEFSELIEIYPDQLFQALGMDKADFTLSRLEPFLATEHFSLVWPIMIIILLISFGGAQIAGEIEKGTIETLLAQPISRAKIFFGKYFAGIANLVIFSIVSIFAVIPLAALHGVEYKLENYGAMILLGFLFGIAIFSLSMLFSTIFSEKGKSNFAVGGIIILMYVMNIISTFKESLKDLKYLSFFHYYDFSAALNRNKIDNTTIWVFLGVAFVTTVLALIIFQKRDIAV